MIFLTKFSVITTFNALKIKLRCPKFTYCTYLLRMQLCYYKTYSPHPPNSNIVFFFSQDRQCRHNEILRRVCVANFAVEKWYLYFVCDCSLSYPARKAYEPRCEACSCLPNS